MVFEKVKKILAEQLNVDAESITMESNIVTDLKADSLDAFEIMQLLEDAFGISVPDEKIAELVVVGDIVKFVESAKK